MLVPVLSGTRSPPPAPAGPRVQEARGPGSQTHTRWRARSILPSALGFGGAWRGVGGAVDSGRQEFVVLVPVGTGKLRLEPTLHPMGSHKASFFP